MARNQQYYSNTCSRRPPIEEKEWVIKIRNTIERAIREDVHTSVSVFCVPKHLQSSKPEAYIPQLFALGPYHHWDSQLYDMQRYKLATLKRTQTEFHNINLQHLIDDFHNNQQIIRSHYHRYLDITGETLAWLMAIDASFLLEFLRNYAEVEGKTYRRVPSMSHMVDSKRIKLAYNLILRDVVMLENQIPLFLLRKIMRFQCSSEEEADTELSKMLMGFVKEVSPFKFLESRCIDVKEHSHLLGLIYYMIVPRDEEDGDIEEMEVHDHDGLIDSDHEPVKEFGDEGYAKQLFTSAWSSVAQGEGAAVHFVKKVLIGKPVKFLGKLPLGSVLRVPLRLMLQSKASDKEKEDGSFSVCKPPLVEEISVPSVTELVQAGVTFLPTKRDLTSIKFDTKTATFYLPEVTLDCNTEVLLRNLVAYESSVELGPVIFSRYTELINGIIDTTEDVKLLRECKVIKNRMKSDQEVADLWNEMMKSVRLTKVKFLDEALEDLNKY
ncbi:hypothetical protein J5N97_027075 [Dioscorea zingiberensis]|uniref:Uncharacterized protein n=1 Tax=Dioscorea zingiberensis TaxID=325984 RepID=A0A9D5C4M0_9LILI|nr:hypothetical protein J5N97_027075 [Dioscorea zingiberensis]